VGAGAGRSPLSEGQLIDLYFMDHRVQVLDLAAFLDRLERAREQDAGDDFRLRSLREALAVLAGGDGDRVKRIQMIFSDPDLALLESLDRKDARGAHDPEA
jgi:hypothetical protein